MKRFSLNKKYITAFAVTLALLAVAVVHSCKDEGYDIEYQDGYPNKLAGNWIAKDYQLDKNNYPSALDTINELNLTDLSEFGKFLQLIKITTISDEYNLVTAIDPTEINNVIIHNLYDNGIRLRAVVDSNEFNARYNEQLDTINVTSLDIRFVSVSGQLVEDDEGDVLIIVAGLYDKERALLESLLIIAYRKTGFENAKYQSLLNN